MGSYLVCSFLSQKSWHAKILVLILDDYIPVAYEERILGEYGEVLAPPELRIPSTGILVVIDHIDLGR